MFDRKVLKTRAKAVLARSYMTIFIACFLVGLIGGGGLGISTRRVQSMNFAEMSNLRILAIFAVLAGLSVIAVAFMIFLVAPLRVGLKKLVLSAASGQEKLEQLLYPFKSNYKNIVLTLFMKNLFVTLWSLLGLIPLGIGIRKFDLINTITSLSQQVAEDSVKAAATLLAIMSVLLIFTLIFSIPATIKELQYALTEYILADNPDTAWRTAIGRSKEMMAGNKWGLVKLYFSFAGWYVAATIFCCIGPLALEPYIEATLAEMYLDICGRGNEAF